jgi:hypothetical protein
MPDTSAPAPAAMLAIVNARVWTGDAHRPWADAVLVHGARIAGIGSSAEIRKRGGAATKVLDARGRMVVPTAPDGRIAAGLPADLLIVERAPGGAAPPAAEDVVLALDQGIVVVDRDGMAT